jgi:hypothetical protein
MHAPDLTRAADAAEPGARALAFAEDLRRLAAISRPSASAGEREAAEWIAARLSELGAAGRVEEERAHGSYWWPVGLPNAVAGGAALAALRRPRRAPRLAAALAGAAAAAALWDDITGGRQWFRRRALPQRSTWNVLAEIGAPPQNARRTVIVGAHHDSAHTGLVFNPALSRFFPDRFPELHARSTQTFPIMVLTWLGPVLTALGGASSRRALLRIGALLSLGTVAAMADIGRSATVPGANDNLSAVVVLLALADSLARRPPPPGVRVILLSTGSEESFMEGMRGFAARHFPALERDRTEMLCLECVGGPRLIVLEGEGMLRMRDYPSATRERLAAAAARAGVEVARGLRTVAATDALIALRAGYEVAQLASIDYTGFPANYHWPSDVPENIDWKTLGEAIAVSEEFVREPPEVVDRQARGTEH